MIWIYFDSFAVFICIYLHMTRIWGQISAYSTQHYIGTSSNLFVLLLWRFKLTLKILNLFYYRRLLIEISCISPFTYAYFTVLIKYSLFQILNICQLHLLKINIRILKSWAQNPFRLKLYLRLLNHLIIKSLSWSCIVFIIVLGTIFIGTLLPSESIIVVIKSLFKIILHGILFKSSV